VLENIFGGAELAVFRQVRWRAETSALANRLETGRAKVQNIVASSIRAAKRAR
jgi:hypothetical protein